MLLSTAVANILERDGWNSVCADGHCLYIRYRGTGWGFDDRASALEQKVFVQAMWVEWKAPKGKPSQAQWRWIELERHRGALVWLAGADFPATVDGFRLKYRESGLARRKLI